MDYKKAILQAITYIEENLPGHAQADLTPHKVAQQAGFSEYHFHRIFAGMLGESVSEYIRKRRLSEAAVKLCRSQKPIMEISLESGYESQEAFTRAFAKMHGLSPGQLRQSGRDTLFSYKRPATDELLQHLIQEGTTMKPQIVERGQELCIGLADSFKPNSFREINRLWNTFLGRTAEIKNVNGSHSLGVCTIKHPSVKIKEGNSFVYMAALPVNSTKAIPEGMVSFTIPAGRYAVFTHKGKLTDLQHTVDYIWGTWIPRGEYECLDGADFELYDERFDGDNLTGEIDIYVPIK